MTKTPLFALILSVTLISTAQALTIEGGMKIENDVNTYQNEEISNEAELKVNSHLLTTKVIDKENPLNIKANLKDITIQTGSAIYNTGYLNILSGSSFQNNTSYTNGAAISTSGTQGLINIYNALFDGTKPKTAPVLFMSIKHRLIFLVVQFFKTIQLKTMAVHSTLIQVRSILIQMTATSSSKITWPAEKQMTFLCPLNHLL